MPYFEWRKESYVQRYNRFYELTPERIQEVLAPLDLQPQDIVLDVGCGDGSIPAYLAPRCRHVVGVDVSEHQIEKARARTAGFSNVTLLHSDCIKLPLGPMPIHKVFSRSALHHLRESEKQIFSDWAWTAMADRGLLLIDDAITSFPLWEFPARRNEIRREAEAFYGDRWSDMEQDFFLTYENEHATSASCWRRYLENAGFIILSIVHPTSFNGQILAQKV